MLGKKHVNDLRDGKALARWIESKVGQPWNKVYSELCDLADSRSKVGHYIRRRIGWEVEMNAIIGNDGLPYTENGYHSIRQPYVHSKTGILCSPPERKIKPKPKKIERVCWTNNKWFELETFYTEAKCGCRHFNFLKKEVAKCIHGNEPIPRNIWYVVEYGEHDLDEVYKVYTYDTCYYPNIRLLYGLEKSGDKYVIYYRDVPDIDRRYIVYRKQANHKELVVLRQLLNNSD